VSKKLVAKEGYTLEVVSWENDGDNYKTKTYSDESLDKIKALQKLCEMSSSETTHKGGLGNAMEDEGEVFYADMIDFIVQNPILVDEKDIISKEDIIKGARESFEECKDLTDEECFEYRFDYYDEEEEKFKRYRDIFMNYNYKLLDSCEWYFSRVYESSIIYYCPEDIYLDIIE
jgi:hypothetical protein